MRVLFSSTSGYGHVFPMLPLARAFRAAGHDVLWATAAQATGLVSGAGIDTTPCGATGPALGDVVGAVRARAATIPGDERAAFVFPRMFGAALTPLMVADLLPLARAWRPDVMIHEQAELASPLVGAVCGVPSLTHSFGGATPADFVAEAGERLAALWAAHGLAVPAHAGCYGAPYLDICPPSVQTVPVDHIADVQPLRPVADVGSPVGDDPLPAEDGRPLVYVTLGTVSNRASALAPIVAAVASLPVRVLVAVGQDVDPAELGSQPDGVRVARWVDQPQVLRRSDVVVSHGGSGTFLGALARGLPQLCLPQAADQFRNAAGGLRVGAVLALPPDRADPDAVADAVARLLVDDDLRRGAARMAAEIDDLPSPAEVVDALVASLRGG